MNYNNKAISHIYRGRKTVRRCGGQGDLTQGRDLKDRL
jgi:hypothetical protein